MISNKRKRIKSILLYILIGIMFIVLVYFTLWKSYLEDIASYLLNGKQEKDLIEQIKIDGVELPFDNNSNTFYFPVNTNDIGKEKELNIEIISNEVSVNIIDGKEYNDKVDLKVSIDIDKFIEIYSNSSFYYSKYYIKFTNLPTMIINNSDKLGIDYVYGNLNIIDPNYKENESKYSMVTDMKVRLRGASSANLPKKSYRICLYENNNKKDLSLLGLRTDSDWILDPLYTDDSKIRTKLSYDIWNLINRDVDKDYYASLNCEYVEVFMGDEYLGLYLLKEPIDEDSLNLKETSSSNSGILLKGVTHDAIDFSEEKIKNIEKEVYCSLELKYPKDLKDNSKYWYNILSKMKEYYSGNMTGEIINNTFYIENLMNYRLFLLAISANDNYEPKNVYFSAKNLDSDTKIVLTPWDLDFTFGVGWKEGTDRGTKLYDKVEEVESVYISDDPQFVNSLKNRWKYLRANVFNETVINNLINEYYNEITISNAVQRDYDKWIESDIETELDEIKKWCKQRFEVIDKYIDKL